MPSEQLANRTLTDEERDKIEGQITLDEMQYALFKKMKGSSAPGIIGFTVNWLRKFWSSLKLVTLNAINEYRDDTLKKGKKDPTMTGFYRPVSLLSIHYKLASCCIKQRLRPLISKVIGQQQKAYIEGNVIGSCLSENV